MTASWWWVTGLFWIAAMFWIAAIAITVLLEPEDFRSAVADVCDDAVHALMTTKDMVELERSKFLISRMHCRLGSRLEARP